MFMIQNLAGQVLNTAIPQDKAKILFHSIDLTEDHLFENSSLLTIPITPARPEKPVLCPPTQVKKRKINRGITGRAHLLHAICHIELNAIDLACDVIARFPHMPKDFYLNWLQVAQEEAKHFTLLSERLRELGFVYGDLPAHNGLWEMAERTHHCLLARLAIIPLIFEARGLDVTPQMIDAFIKAEDQQSADILKIIYEEEIGHVALGHRWFCYLCEQEQKLSIPTWHSLVQKYFSGSLKPPFNENARRKAGLTPEYYLPLAS